MTARKGPIMDSELEPNIPGMLADSDSDDEKEDWENAFDGPKKIEIIQARQTNLENHSSGATTLAASEVDIEALRQQISTLQLERDTVSKDNQRLTSQKNSIAAERDIFRDQLQTTRAELDKVNKVLQGGVVREMAQSLKVGVQ
ncbi:hypothetical protein HDV00_006373 [Rhizophlyctis rosea]|nr:hypothetical protein HDV00_006373 [Rhizophlyctis rosea]